MAKRELHFIDNVLIVAGWFLVPFGGLAVMGSLLPPATPESLVPSAVLLLTGTGCMVSGYVLRAKENKIVAIWRILEHALEVRVEELVRSTGFDRKLVLETVRLLNVRGLAYFVWDQKSDSIIDGRLRTTHLHVDRCPTCGAGVDQNVPLDLSAPLICRYCRTAVSSEHLGALKVRLLESLRATPRPPAAQAARAEFNPVTFILLTVLCGPFGMIYAIRCFMGGARQGVPAVPTHGGARPPA